MKLIVGLGNPGKQYEKTRHNVGFLVVDALLKACGTSLKCAKGPYKINRDPIDGGNVAIGRSETYMNESGAPVRQMLEDFKLAPSQCLVVADDVNLPIGKVRFREKGSAGGHHGLESIIAALGTQDFPRLRIGIGLPDSRSDDLSDHVLGPFSTKEIADLAPQIERARDACLEWIKGSRITL